MKQINIIIIILVIFLNSSCSNSNDDINNVELRFKFLFSGNQGIIIGDKSNKLVKKFNFTTPINGDAKFFHNDLSNNIYATWIEYNNGEVKAKILHQNIIDIFNIEGEYSDINSSVITIEPIAGERIIDIVIDKNERILMLTAPEDYDLDDKIFIKRVDNNNNSQLLTTIDLLGNSSQNYRSENTHYIKQSNQIVCFKRDSESISINLDNLIFYDSNINTNIEHCRNVFFWNNNETFFLKRNSSENTETLFTFGGQNRGSLSIPFNGGGFACGVSIGYDKIDNRLEYISYNNSENASGYINTDQFELIEESTVQNSNSFFADSSHLFFFEITE